VLLVCVNVLVMSLAGCGDKANIDETIENAAAEQTLEASNDDNKQLETIEEEVEESLTKAPAKLGEIQQVDRPTLIEKVDNSLYDASLTPSVPTYQVASDYSNVINPEEIAYACDEFKEKLAKNQFVVGDVNGQEFFETYEFNAYSQTPNFVTVDSLMHTYHLYFAHLLKSTEKN